MPFIPQPFVCGGVEHNLRRGSGEILPGVDTISPEQDKYDWSLWCTCSFCAEWGLAHDLGEGVGHQEQAFPVFPTIREYRNCYCDGFFCPSTPVPCPVPPPEHRRWSQFVPSKLICTVIVWVSLGVYA